MPYELERLLEGDEPLPSWWIPRRGIIPPPGLSHLAGSGRARPTAIGKQRSTSRDGPTGPALPNSSDTASYDDHSNRKPEARRLYGVSEKVIVRRK